jgi:predicted RNA-binding protein YlxR (DUF448 family)
VAKKTAKRVKHVPQRTCVGCRQTQPKRSLIRIVRTPGGLQVDPTGKLSGRGAYLHDDRSCWESGLKGALAHALKVELTDQDRDTLRAFMASLPEETPSEDQPAARGEIPPGMAQTDIDREEDTSLGNRL